MPTFFGRRYMRKRVPPTEKAIGAAILVVLAGIVIGGVVVATREQPGLFALPPDAAESQTLSREQRIGRQLMPTFATAGWTVPETIRTLDRAALTDAGETELVNAGAVWVYRGAYTNAVTEETVSVTVVDADNPANAFGLFSQRRPAETAGLAAGNEGWRTDQRGAFWSGRYYTEFDRTDVRAEVPAIATIADALSSAQIAYGSPFAAEALLPRDDRADASFRFVRREAVGFKFLSNAFLADYPGEVTAFVTTTESAGEAADLIGKFAAFLSEQGRVQSAPTPPESPILAGDFADRQLAVFAAGEAVLGAVGGDMEPVSAVVKQMLDLVGSRGGAAGQAATADADVSPFPAIEMENWQSPVEWRVYTPQNLWEKIDGRAEVYLQFDMRRMVFGTYRHRHDESLFLDVLWYEMGDPDGAFGVYRAESGGHATKLDVGQDGYAQGGGVFFWKGSEYVRIEAGGEDAALEEAATAVARAIAAGIEGGDEPMWADAMLPRENRTDEEISYHGENAFSLDFLSEVFSADYAADGKSYTAFIHRATSPEDAAAMLAKYEAFFKDYGSVLERGRVDGFELLVGDSGGYVDAVFVSGAYVGGVNNTPDAKLAREQALSFARAMAVTLAGESQ